MLGLRPGENAVILPPNPPNHNKSSNSGEGTWGWLLTLLIFFLFIAICQNDNSSRKTSSYALRDSTTWLNALENSTSLIFPPDQLIKSAVFTMQKPNGKMVSQTSQTIVFKNEILEVIKVNALHKIPEAIRRNAQIIYPTEIGGVKFVNDSSPYIFHGSTDLCLGPLVDFDEGQMVCLLRGGDVQQLRYNYMPSSNGPPRGPPKSIRKVFVVGNIKCVKGIEQFGNSNLKTKIVDLRPSIAEQARYDANLRNFNQQVLEIISDIMHGSERMRLPDKMENSLNSIEEQIRLIKSTEEQIKRIELIMDSKSRDVRPIEIPRVP